MDSCRAHFDEEERDIPWSAKSLSPSMMVDQVAIVPEDSLDGSLLGERRANRLID